MAAVGIGLTHDYHPRMHAVFMPSASSTAGVDQRLVLHGVPWSVYESMTEARGEGSVPRLAYSEGDLEIMSPSEDHEWVKSMLGYLLQAYAEERGIELGPFGSVTLKDERRRRGAEGDQTYVLGPRPERIRAPDLVIEVVLTSGGVDKLSIYRRLGVREVWFWEKGRISVHVLGARGYVRRTVSALLPDLDLRLVAKLATADRPTQAVKALRASLRRRRPTS
ncbi:MAG: Uma2 family endonuclease [Myxococcales bacterium]